MPFLLRKLFENVIHENEEVNTKKERHGIQEMGSNTGESQRGFPGSRWEVPEPQLCCWPRELQSQLRAGRRRQERYLKLPGTLSDTFSYVNNHVKKPSIWNQDIQVGWQGEEGQLSTLISKSLQERKHNYNTVLGFAINSTYIVMIT